MSENIQTIAFITAIVVVCFGALFGALRSLLNKGIKDMKETVKAEIKNLNSHCKLVSGNLHCEIISETKQRVIADNRIETTFKDHGHKGLDNGGSKVTI